MVQRLRAADRLRFLSAAAGRLPGSRPSRCLASVSHCGDQGADGSPTLFILDSGAQCPPSLAVAVGIRTDDGR